MALEEGPCSRLKPRLTTSRELRAFCICILDLKLYLAYIHFVLSLAHDFVMSGVVISYDKVSSNGATSVPNFQFNFQYIHIFAVNAFVVRVCN